MSRLTPFDYVNSITYSKQNLMTEETEREYVPFIINRTLSYFVDSVLYANDMNIYHDLPKSVQYKYFLNSISKRKRFSKWAKRLENDDIDLVSRLYQCNDRRASEILSVLTPSELETLKQLDTGNGNERRRGK